MNVEYQQITRRIRALPGIVNTFILESGTPYRHLTMWVWVHTNGTKNLTAQPQYGGVNDGGATVITDNIPAKVFQVTVEEVRPANRIRVKHPDDVGPAVEIDSSIDLTNTLTPAALVATYTWDGTTTVLSADTSEVATGNYIRLDSDGQWFKIISIVTDTSVEIENPDRLTIPSGATQSSVSDAIDLSLYMIAAAAPGGA
jgi:hypothetical protein